VKKYLRRKDRMTMGEKQGEAKKMVNINVMIAQEKWGDEGRKKRKWGRGTR
jgi:hypothetical protein